MQITQLAEIQAFFGYNLRKAAKIRTTNKFDALSLSAVDVENIYTS